MEQKVIENVLHDLIKTTNNLSKAPFGLTFNNVLMNTPLGPVKIRKYASIDDAKRIEALLLKIANTIEFPELFGRWQQYLVFKYLEIETKDKKLREQATYFGIGRFLANLNTMEMPNTNLEELDTEFFDWLYRFGVMGLLPKWIVKKTHQYYQNFKPENLIVRLDYWDAMPHNFGWVSNKLLLLDEKHLRPSFSGVGLIKLLFLCNIDQWNQIRTGYESVAPLVLFEKQREFLSFYYRVAALYFYSLAAEAGRLVPVKNNRFLKYRDEIIATVTNTNLPSKILCDFHMLVSFPKYIPNIITNRLHCLKVPKKNRRLRWKCVRKNNTST